MELDLHPRSVPYLESAAAVVQALALDKDERNVWMARLKAQPGDG